MVKNPPANAGYAGDAGPWRKKWQPTAVFLPEKNPINRGTLGSMGPQRVRQDRARTYAVVIGNNTLLKKEREGGRKEERRRKEGERLINTSPEMDFLCDVLEGRALLSWR